MITIPTIQELNDGILANFEAEFGVTLNPYGRAFLTALAGVMAMCLWLVYLGIGATQKNIWFDTCDYETLIRFGTTILGRFPFAATKGQYTVTVTGSIGGVIPASTVYRADDNSAAGGKLYQVAATTTLSATSQDIVINALEGGDASTLQPGDTLTATAPMINVNAGAVVATEDINPENAEDMELYRAKIGDKVRLTPGSWNAVDYRLVGTEVTGVGGVYAYGISDTEVDVWIQGTTPVADPGPSASPTVISDYQTALDAVRPMPAFIINVDSCPINDVDITITMGSFPAFTVAQKTLIEQAVTQFVNSVRPFIAVADNVDERNDTIATYNLSAVISQAVPGYGFSSVTFTVAGSPTTLWVADNGNIAFMNGITYA